MQTSNANRGGSEQEFRHALDEMHRRFRAGEPCRAEELLEAYPSLAAATERAADLVYTEFVLRREQGQDPSPLDW